MLVLLFALAGAEPDPMVRAGDQWFGERAASLEAAARAGAVDADELWWEAAEIRRGLGQGEQAAADLDAREAARRGDPARVAALFWSRRAALASEDERLAHAEQFLKLHGRHARRDLRVLAEATVGTILWRRACARDSRELGCLGVQLFVAMPSGGRDGPAVLKRKPRRSKPGVPNEYRRIPRRCDVDEEGHFTFFFVHADRAGWTYGRSHRGGLVTAFPRDERLAARARRHLERAARLARDAELPPETREEVAEVLALAAVYRVDPQLWSLYSLEPPAKPRFAPDPWVDERTRARQAREVGPSRREHAAYLRALAERTSRLRAQYAELLRDEAAARLPGLWMRAGLVESFIVMQLGYAEIPAGSRSMAEAELFCASFAPQVDAAEAATVAAWSRCVAAGAEHGRDVVVARCEAMLAVRSPRKWAVSAEMFAEPGPTWPAAHGVQLELAEGPER